MSSGSPTTSPVSTTTASAVFPHGFLWGTATAAYQIEGSVGADGRGPSIWDTFSHQAGATHNGDTGDVTCDHYRLMDQDLDLLGELGAPAYRFSTAWPRVQPSGKGPVNQEGLDFYRRLVDGLRQRGIVPVLTLYHWDLPQPLQDGGGWVARDTVGYFADYAATLAEALGDGVGLWITLNEPWCSAWAGYGSGRHAPGVQDLGAAAAATHHLLLGHGTALQAIRATRADAVAGITLNLSPIRPASDRDEDRAAACRVDGNLNRLFLEPLLRGRYPADMLEHYGGHRPGFSVVGDGDLEVISQPIDFLGVNFYAPSTVAAKARSTDAGAAGWVPLSEPDPVRSDLGAISVRRPGAPRTEMGWEIEAGALTELLLRVRADYGRLPIYVTENGVACSDYVDPYRRILDRDRIKYLNDHLTALLDAVARDIDIRGYFLWSLLDNFEWAHGYSKRFGLTWVDYPSGTRIPKASFCWYREVVRTNSLPPVPSGALVGSKP